MSSAMVNSSEIPSSYTTKWNIGTHQPPTQTPVYDGSLRPRYNSSCNNCRKSRVKCSGGTPCERCTKIASASSCVYKICQRHGKRKARHIDTGLEGSISQEATVGASFLSTPIPNDSFSLQSMIGHSSDLSDMEQFSLGQPYRPDGPAQSAVSYCSLH